MSICSKPKVGRCLSRVSGLILGGLLFSGGLTIQSPVQGATAYNPPIDEIVVTARKREELLLEVPVAVTALTAETIKDLRLVRLNDVARHTPGFSFTSATGRQPASDRPLLSMGFI
jgi:outer membrane cobalamin receptor